MRRFAFALLLALATSAEAATTVTIQPAQAFTRGVTIYAPRAVAANATRVTVTVDRAGFTAGDAGVAVSWSLFLSLDGGVSWLPWGGAGTVGGVDPALTVSSFSIDLPQVGNANRQIAAVMAVTGNITLAITATVFP